MLAQLRMVLDTNNFDFNFNKASVLHGVIMENIDYEYANKLHEDGLKPYAQFIRREENKYVWYIKTISIEAYENIIEPLNSLDFKEFVVKHNALNVKIIEKRLDIQKLDDFFDSFYDLKSARVYNIEFKTPTAFKSSGKYQFYPEVEKILQSIMNKMNSVMENKSVFDEEVYEQLCNSIEIVGYNLHSIKFELEGTRIPAFMGSITIKIHGNQTMCTFMKKILEFGNYSGVGIKTALGMGNIECIEKNRKEKAND